MTKYSRTNVQTPIAVIRLIQDRLREWRVAGIIDEDNKEKKER